MSTMICLVGDQPLPNFLPIRHYQRRDPPLDTVLLVYTEQKKQQYQYLKETLQKKALQEKRKLDFYELDTEAFYTYEIVQRLNEELTYLLSSQPPVPITLPLIFNLTGGTKAMSLAAYHVAQLHNAAMIYAQSAGKDMLIYHSEWDGEQLQTTGSEVIPEYLTLEDVFDLHLCPEYWQSSGPSKDTGGLFEKLIADTLAKNYEVMAGVKTLNRQLQIDIAVRSGNQYGIIEAKSGNNGSKLDGIKQLSIAIPLLGTYSRAFHVITVAPNSDHAELRDALKIEVIPLLSYNATDNTISPADKEELLIRIEDAFNGVSGGPFDYS